MRRIGLLAAACVLLAGCGQPQEHKDILCHMVFEEYPGITIEEPVQTVFQGENVTFVLNLPEGYELLSVDDPAASIVRDYEKGQVKVQLSGIRYSETLKGEFSKSDAQIRYEANGGKVLGSGDNSESFVSPVWKTHLRVNTAIGTDRLERDGYTLAGWNTRADGTGTAVGLGSRIAMEGQEMTLYAVWKPWTNPDAFETENVGDYVVITGYKPEAVSEEEAECLVIPEKIQGKTVLAVAEGAIVEERMETLILPVTLQRLEKNAAASSNLKSLYLFDSIQKIDDYSLMNCPNLQTLHINAVEAPVYSGNYFASFQDKFDRLWELKDKQKLVLFSGSSTRFGYDSAKIDQAFPEYEVVNMGVFAYSNALPQLRLIEICMQEGDILLDSPEFDAAKRQFFTTDELDDSFFCMMEANYDTLALLDLRQYRKVFSSLNTYLSDKESMTPQAYRLSPADFDEDGNALEGEKSYNLYGDYCLYRENAATDEPIYNLPVEYTVRAFPKETYVDSANRVYRELKEPGIKAYLTYSPRNREAVSEDSTPEERERLDQYFRENLEIPIISKLEDSLYPGRYLYGTDNHLSTEGVAIRTERVIEDLERQLEGEMK